MQTSDQIIYQPDSAYTIRSLAGTLMRYHSAWLAADWVASPQDARSQVEARWIEAIRRLNPGVGADEVLSRDRPIQLPNESETGRAILAELKDRLSRETKLVSSQPSRPLLVAVPNTTWGRPLDGVVRAFHTDGTVDSSVVLAGLFAAWSADGQAIAHV
jgi:hypothetical protein